MFEWTKREEENLRRLKKAKKLLELARDSGRLIDVSVSASPETCVIASIALINYAILAEEEDKKDTNG